MQFWTKDLLFMWSAKQVLVSKSKSIRELRTEIDQVAREVYPEFRLVVYFFYNSVNSMLPCVWFSNRSQKTSKCGKNISDTLGYASCATFLFLPHFDIICDLLLNRCTATWNLFVKYTTLNHICFVKQTRYKRRNNTMHICDLSLPQPTNDS